MSIYKKLWEIQKSVRGFSKDKKGHGYDYVSGDKVLGHVRSKMDELGVLLKQEVTSIENERMNYRTGIGTQYEKDKSEILSKVMQKFTWVCAETGEKDENLFGANGQNDWDKGVGSALTYAERYFVLKYFHIPTDQDDIDNPERKVSPTDQDDIDNPERKVSPTDQDDKKKQEANNDDGLPWLTEKQFNALLARINKGEKLLTDAEKTFRMKKTYKETLSSAEQNYKPTT